MGLHEELHEGPCSVELSVRTAQSEGRALNQAEASQGAEAVAGG